MRCATLSLLLCLSLAWPVVGQSSSRPTISRQIESSPPRPGQPLMLVRLIETMPMSLDDMTRRSTAVVEGILSNARTYIDESDTDVLTDFEIIPMRVLAGSLTPVQVAAGARATVVLRVNAGEVERNGVRIHSGLAGLEMPIVNTTYVMFLQPATSDGAKPVPGVYRLFNGAIFERAGDRLVPLAQGGFGAFRGMTDRYADVAAKIAAARATMGPQTNPPGR
ncbi:MAG: hypothetical protein IT184_03710 [Acidobacteria bacterium]|nr:hypothetical protein [Acidobacteriota bacterium]